jgi:hypothetical protein
MLPPVCDRRCSIPMLPRDRIDLLPPLANQEPIVEQLRKLNDIAVVHMLEQDIFWANA